MEQRLLRPKDAAKMVLNAFECSKKIHTANQTIGLLLSIIKKTNPEQKAAIYESLFEDVALVLVVFVDVFFAVLVFEIESI